MTLGAGVPFAQMKLNGAGMGSRRILPDPKIGLSPTSSRNTAPGEAITLLLIMVIIAD